MPGPVVLIGQLETCLRLEKQLDLLDDRPVTMGWVLADSESVEHAPSEAPVLGAIAQLEAIIAHRRPSMALISLPAVLSDQIQSIRTRLRRLEIPDRFFPTLEDQLLGVGPRSQFTISVHDLLDRPARTIDEEAISNLLKGKRVLITGAGGSIGSELARLSAKFKPSELVLCDRSENSLFEIDRQIARFFPDQSRRALLHDIVRREKTLERFKQLKPQVIFHSAAHKHVPMMENHPAAAVENNLFGTKSVADAASACDAEQFVMISTDKAVNPSSIMGATKRLAEMYIQHIQQTSDTSFSMVRFGNVLGSSGSVIDTWTRQITEGGPVTVTDPRMTRYFMTIPEAAALVFQSAALVADHGEAEVFLLNMGEPVKIADLARRFVELHGLVPISPENAEITGHAPGRSAGADSSGTMHISYTGVRPGEKLFEELARDVEALQPTRHPDIDIWSLPPPDPQHIEEILCSLSNIGHNSRSGKVAEIVRNLVPEMIQPVAA